MIVSASKCTLRCFPPFAFVTLTTVLWFDVARRDSEQLVDPYPRAPQHPQHEVVARAALVRRFEHLVDLFLFKVVGDVLHYCRKGMLSAITVVILNRVSFKIAV